MQLLAWLGLCAVLAYGLRRRPVAGVVLAISVWLLVPAVAGGIVTGRDSGALSFHPATWLIMALLAMQLLTDDSRLLKVLARHIFLVLVLGLVVGVSVLTTRYSDTSGGMVLLFDQMVGPVALFLLVVSALDTRPEGIRVLRTTLLWLATLASALTVAQWLAGGVLVYESYFRTIWWFNHEGFDRWMGTTDHPLTLSLLLCVVTPLAAGISRVGLQLPYLALAGVAVVITQSRSGLAIMAVMIVFVVARSRASTGVKVAFTLVLGIAGTVLAASSLATGVQSRIADDSGSTEARGAAVRFFADRWEEFAILGKGFTASYRVGQVGGLGTSLESSFLMYAVDIGLLFTVLYFGAQAIILLRSGGRVQTPGLVLAGTLALLLPHTYSALASGSAVGALLWTFMGLLVAEQDAHSPAPAVAEELEPEALPVGTHW